MIYYGDEYGMQGAQDPDCRRGMYWDEKYQNQEMYRWYQRLIDIRKKHPCICEGDTEQLRVNDENGTLELRRRDEREAITILFNCSNKTNIMDEYSGRTNVISKSIFEGMLKSFEVVILE